MNSGKLQWYELFLQVMFDLYFCKLYLIYVCNYVDFVIILYIEDLRWESNEFCYVCFFFGIEDESEILFLCYFV